MKAEEILEAYKSTTVRAMLEKAAGSATTVKANNIQRLAPLLANRARIINALEALTEAEKGAIARIHQKRDEIGFDRLQQLLMADGVIGPSPKGKTIYQGRQRANWHEGNPNYSGKPAFEDLMARLALNGLVFSRESRRVDRSVIEWTPGRVIFIPDFIARFLPVENLPELPDPATIDPTHVVAGSARNFQRDLGRYGRYLRRHGEIPLTTQGLIYKKNLKEIAADLSFPVDLGSGMGEEDNGRLYFTRRLLPKIGLAINSYNALLPHEQDEKFWQMDPLQRVKHTFGAWQDSGAWNELRQLPSYERGYDKQHDAPKGLVQSRQTVLKHIKQMGAGWINLSELIDEIRDKDYGFLFPKRVYPGYWYYGSGIYTTPYHTGNNPYGITFRGIRDEADGWKKVEALFISHLIAGPLFWMGLLDLGYNSEPAADLRGVDPPAGYRLTEMGGWLLGLRGKVEIASEGGAVVVQPNFEILAMEPISDEVLLTLDQFADTKGGDRVITYTLNRASVYRGQRNDWPVDRIVAYLETAMQRPLPDNVKRSLEEWDALHRRITIRQGINLIHTVNEEVRQQIAGSAVGGHLRASGAGVLLSDAPFPELARGLRQAGWLPVQTWSGQTGAPNSVSIDDDGRVRYVHSLPSIYAQGAIAPLSVEASPEHDQGAQRRITPAMVKANLRQDQTVDDLMTRLRSVHQGELPAALILKIKAWGNYYGNARQETLTLIEFCDNNARDELLADPDLQAYLIPFTAGERPLAVIHPDYIDLVNERLAERGVDVTIGLKKKRET